MGQPLVSALCVTRNRRHHIPQAINCFLDQSYQNKELVIVTDDDAEDISDLVPPVDRIRLITIPRPPTLGEKRNLGVQLCRGEVIAHLDDDDIYVPTHIELQVLRLLSTGAAVVGYQNAFFTDGKDRWIYHGGGHPAIGLGASLVYSKSWALANPFPARSIAEDNAFVNTAFNSVKHPTPGDPECPTMKTHGRCQERLYSGISGLGMMVARRHGENTSKQRMTDINYIPYVPFPDIP